MADDCVEHGVHFASASYVSPQMRELHVAVTPRDADPDYTIRAWRAVVTYLLRQHEFLYE